MRTKSAKSARLNVRVTPDLLDQIRQAAQMQGQPLSDYVSATMRAAVERDIAEAGTMRLSREDSEKVAEMLINAHHRRLVESK
jgi:uncharacterized protein (DUF1778 family)